MAMQTVTVTILDKEYKVACPEEDQREGLLQAARYLDQQMRSIRDAGKVIGLERIAVMAALNISYELLSQEQPSKVADSAPKGDPAATFSELNQKLDEALHQLRQMEIG